MAIVIRLAGEIGSGRILGRWARGAIGNCSLLVRTGEPWLETTYF
jgi:hypothetical protein